MGRALDVAYDMIEDKTKIPKNAYRPVVVLVSDGAPNDDHWETSSRSLLLQVEVLSVTDGVLRLEPMLTQLCLRSSSIILKRKYATLKMLQISISSSALSPHARFSEARARIRIRWHRTCLRPIF